MLISFGLNILAQVAINNDGSAPDGFAILEIKSTTGGCCSQDFQMLSMMQ